MRTCMTCDGSGWISPGWLGTPPDPSERERGCPDCGGTGVDDAWNQDWEADELEAPPEEDDTWDTGEWDGNALL